MAANTIETKVTIEENKDTKKKDVKVEVTDCLAFDGDMKNNIMTTNKLCGIISAFFGSFLQDYYGCEINMYDGSNLITKALVPEGQLYVNLYFKDQGPSIDGRLKCIEMNGSDGNANKSSSITQRYFAFQQTYAGTNMYHLTEEAKILLSKFMFGYNPNPNWALCYKEVLAPMTANPNSKPEVISEVIGFDLNKIITMIYGTRDENSSYDYRTCIASNIGCSNYMTNVKNFLIQISQLDIAFVKELENELGFNSYNNSFYVWNRA